MTGIDIFGSALAGLQATAGAITRLTQPDRLRPAIMIILVVIVAIAGPPIVRAVADTAGPDLQDWRAHELLVIALAGLGAVATTQVRSRLAALAVLGLVGTGLSLIFMLFSAPDLALTQVMVEVLLVVLLVMVLVRLPRVVRRSGRASRWRDAVVAAAVGITMTFFVLAATSAMRDPQLSQRFLADSGPLAHGRNVVNVILVDFRALDTLGEITVLALAGLGVASLLRNWRPADDEEGSA